MQQPVTDDLRGDIAAAFAADAKTQETPPEPISASEPSAVEPVAASAPQAPAEAIATDTPGTSELARDERGRFAPKTQDTAPATSAEPEKAPAAATPEEPQVATKEEPGKPPLAPPRYWADRSKVKWQQLPRAIQEDLLKVESQGRLGALQSVIEPYAQRIAMKGQMPEQTVQALLATWDGLERPETRENTFRLLAQAYGIDLGRFAPPAQGNGSQVSPVALDSAAGEPEYVDPQVRTLSEKLSGMQQQIDRYDAFIREQAQREEQQRFSYTDQIVNSFRSDPKNAYFDVVQEDMAAILNANPSLRVNPAQGLQRAYEMAVWGNPTTREALLAQQQEAEQSRRDAEEKARAERSRAAAGSVTGSPSPGASVAVGSDLSLRADLERQIYGAARA